MSYERITSRKNPLLQHVRRLLTSRSCRESSGQFAADGTKLLAEAARWCPERLHTVLVTANADLCPLPDHVRVVEIPDDVMAQVSPMETPQGALFICTLPEEKPLNLTPGSLILDGIQDPGNLGTILRTADALEVPVILTPGCADVYNHKTVRASMGAVFRTPPQWAEPEALAAQCRQKGIPLYVTALSDRAVDLRRAELSQAALVIGSEGRGVGTFFLSHSDQSLIIPMNPRCESLNAAVAAAIVMWQMKL